MNTTDQAGIPASPSAGEFIGGFTAVAAFLMLLRWEGSGIWLGDYFVWDGQWLSTLGVLAMAGLAGWLASEIQPTWERDGGWSPRTFGYVIGVIIVIAIAVDFFRRGF